MLDEANMPYSACVRCTNCDGFPCLVHAKSDAEVLGVRPALEHATSRCCATPGRCAWRPTPPAPRSPGCVVERDGQQETYAADIVVVSGGAANSAKLLLVSANERHPNGLANGSDQVGRNYMFHNSAGRAGALAEENPTVFQKTLGLNDYYFGGHDFEYPMGNIQMVGKSQAPMFRGEKPLMTALAPTWSLEQVARHAVDFWLSTEDLPMPRTASPSTATGPSRSPTRRPTRSPGSGCSQQLNSMLGTSACTSTICCPATPT